MARGTVAALLLLLAAAASGIFVDKGMANVVELKSLDDLGAGENTFVLFYLPTCGFCKSVAREWARLAVADHVDPDSDDRVTFAKAHGDVVKHDSVTGFPTILLFKADGSTAEYRNHPHREVPEFIEFLNAETGVELTRNYERENTVQNVESEDTAQTEGAGAEGTVITFDPSEDPNDALLAETWFYTYDQGTEETSEPLRYADVKKDILKGSLMRSSLFAIAGDAEWRRGGDMKEFNELFKFMDQKLRMQNAQSDGKGKDGVEDRRVYSDYTYQMTFENLNEHVADGRYWIIAATTPKCGFCVALAPEWKKLGDIIRQDSKDYATGHIDIERERMLVARFDIKAFPYIFILTPDGGRISHTQPTARDANSLYQWLRDVKVTYEKEKGIVNDVDEEDEL